MARCPGCRRHFAVLEDEDPRGFDCPHCGYGEAEPESCPYCSKTLDKREDDEDAYPYCSDACSINAERDSAEDYPLTDEDSDNEAD